MNLNEWDLTEESWTELWRPPTTPRDTSGNIPERVGDSVYPVEARAIILHVIVAAALPAIYFAGRLLHASGFLPEIIVCSIILGFVIGLAKYIRAINERARVAEQMPGLRPSDLGESPSLIALAIRPLILWPLAIAGTSVYATWSENHFIAIALPAFACFYAFFYLGAKPVEFLQEYLMAQPEVEPIDRKFRPRGHAEPNLGLLLSVLFLALTAPILLSAAHTYLLLFCVLVGFLISKLGAFRHERPLTLVSYLLKRCHLLAKIYLDQPDVRPERVNEQWIPPSTRVERFLTFTSLLVPLYALLLTMTTYYCPWEFFAGLFVPNFETNFLFVPETRTYGYGWLYSPFLLSFAAEPVAAYLLTFVAAIVGFLAFPPLLFFALYFDRILSLESLHQEIKSVRRSSAFA